MPEPSHDELMIALRKAADALTADHTMRDVEATVTNLVSLAVAIVPGAEGGGVSRTETGTVRSSHATTEGIHELDQLQSTLGQGPCITAADDPPEAGVVLADDLAGRTDTDRWPSFAPAAVAAGYRSILSVQLSLGRTRRSALNLYSARAHVYDTSAQLTAGLFGLQAAVLLHGADHAAQLGHALASRDVIGQAKGILMERFTVGDEEAFRLLVSSSQDTNVKLVDVARWLTAEAEERSTRRAAVEGSSPP